MAKQFDFCLCANCMAKGGLDSAEFALNCPECNQRSLFKFDDLLAGTVFCPSCKAEIIAEFAFNWNEGNKGEAA
jgi:hypothetical protein